MTNWPFDVDELAIRRDPDALAPVRLRESGRGISYRSPMRAVVNPRGRLPARVYWFRRTMVLLTAVALVFAIGRMLNGSGGSSPSGDTARVTAGTTTPTTATATTLPAGPLPIQPTGKAARPSATGTPVALAAPSGPCSADEITVTPTVSGAVAGRRVDLVLELTSIKPACTFAVSSKTVVAKVTSGPDRIWSTQDCPTAVRTHDVVVRSAVPTKVIVAWSGRRSDDDCSRSTDWALPGYYHVTAAVMGSEPSDVQFRLTSPPRPVVTKTAKPKNKKHKQGTGTVCGGDNSATSC